MSVVQVSVNEFRSLFKQFENKTVYSDSFLKIMLDVAKLYISDKKNCFVKQTVQKQMIYLMAAHLTVCNSKATTGDSDGGLITSASIDKVSVSKQIPTLKSMLDAWLWQSAYGQQLSALLQIQATVGIYVGGTKENVFR